MSLELEGACAEVDHLTEMLEASRKESNAKDKAMQSMIKGKKAMEKTIAELRDRLALISEQRDNHSIELTEANKKIIESGVLAVSWLCAAADTPKSATSMYLCVRVYIVVVFVVVLSCVVCVLVLHFWNFKMEEG
mgnify:CR=1 FL=1